VVCGSEQMELPRERRGRRAVRYRHYLAELAKKPQALRQVAQELVAELGEPCGRPALGAAGVVSRRPRGGAGVGRRTICAIVEHGEAEVTEALSLALWLRFRHRVTADSEAPYDHRDSRRE
jgi:hypothetical protein